MQPTARSDHSEPIAIIGSGCRFPGNVGTTSQLWELLREPRDVLEEIPTARFNASSWYHEDGQFPGHSNVRHSYILNQNVAHFDAPFFSIQAAEAAAMDPQQRLLLETVYEGLESAGLTMEGLKGSDTGVYVGLMYGDYEALQFRDLQKMPTYHSTGNARSIASNRVSYFFDWHGPSMTIDTACSSSLVAVSQAVQALRAGHIPVAVAAGSNLLLGPEPYVYHSNLRMLSPDSRSRMWDAGANGYARGDGVAAVVLKTLSAALADGDNIECVIREIGVNQDGRSPGITMPSATAQAALIRSTYARAGLDPQNKQDRCHYFEAHGTGTQAGDPVEAEAIQLAFFGKDRNSSHQDEPLYVGSIKTVIGHTEATAGIAGLLKAAQALKHSCVPPNLLLDRLNPSVEPFYKNVLIPQEPTPWPKICEGQPRRASVNSFGFGGTNAHVILESFDTYSSQESVIESSDLGFIPPFVFSAQSEQSLAATLAAYLEHLELNPDMNPYDLSYVLRERRSQLPLRVSLPGSSISILQKGLKELLGKDLNINRATNSGKEVRLLGVFTGQGAQWARMGAELVESLPEATKFLLELDESLAHLPQHYRPSWTLRSELLADTTSSKVGEAFISQPLCTAIQIVLIKLLRLIGINFAAVVGHSSGEIAAAFAAGYLTEEQAIRIAYYRGLHSHLAGGPNGVKGAMLAVGTSQEDAEELCKDPQFKGRVGLAACNSPSSVTLSGDEDAITGIAAIFEEENKFVRRLKVDKAYHSHHMQPCADAYLLSMETDGSQVQKTEPRCLWVSSVYPDRAMKESPEASYWIDNLTSPVLFMQAVDRVLSADEFDAAIEVGPHPALKGPVKEILAERKLDLPYTGLLQRKKDGNHAFSGALGYLWENLENVNLNFDAYQSGSDKTSIRRHLPNLPVYQWNHSQEYWHESIISQKLRQRKHAMHPLLGNLSPTSSAHQFVWKHILRPQDLPWVHGHRIQGQTVFPAAGYAVTALESAFYIAADEPVKLVSIENLVIHQATVLDEDGKQSGIEIQFAVNNINREKTGQITAHFTYEAHNGSQEGYQLVANGILVVDIGEPTHDLLPVSSSHELDTTEVPINSFYSALEEIGYGYTGPFRAFSQLRRRFGAASGVIMPLETDDEYTLHPAILDVGFQATFAALSYPRDGRFRALHLPTSIKRMRVNPALCGRYLRTTNGIPITSVLTNKEGARGYHGDIEFHDAAGNNSAIQVEGFGIVPMSEFTPADDRQVFYNTDWVEAEPNADIPGTYEATAKERELAMILERVSCFYLRQLKDQFPADHPGRKDKFNAAYLEFAEYIHNLCVTGKHKYAKKEWLRDTLEDIHTATAPFAELSEVRVAHLVGEQMPRAILGETTMVEQLLMTGVLDEYYAQALGFVQVASVLADTVLQITRRYPDARILEVGAGTGSATRQVLQRLKGSDFGTYTFTDISTGFFGNAAVEFADYKNQMTFKVLNLEHDIASQGFEKNSYDVVVASLVVHATENLDQTMRRVRSLLKPGGYLVMSEGTNLDATRVTHVFGCLPGWWLGRDEGRVWGPSVTVDQWDEVLRKSGFSGVDSMTPTSDDLSYLNSVIISQAVDDWVSTIREPLLTSASLFAKSSPIQELVIVGGGTFQVSRLVDGVYKLVGSLCDDISRYKTLDELVAAGIGANATILVLADLDQPVFKDMSEARLEGLKRLFESEKTIMWVTKDRLGQNPFSNMIVGFARSVLWEVPDLQYQLVDFEATTRIDPRVISECLLRFKASVSQPQSKREKYLWSTEWEVIIDVDGRQRIPRLKAAQYMNDRYNSNQRSITKEVQLENSIVTISDNDHRCIVEDQLTGSVPDEDIYLKVTHSTVQKFPTILGDYYLVLGNCCKTQNQYIAVADTLTSSSKVPQSQAVPVSVSSQLSSVILGFIMSRLTVPSVLNGLQRGDSVLIHNAPIILASVLAQEASIRGISLFFTTTSQDAAKLQGWHLLNEYMLPSHLRAVLPHDLVHAIDFTESNVVSILSNDWISSIVASRVRRINTATFSQMTHHQIQPEEIGAIVVKALADLEKWEDIPTGSEVDAQEFANAGGSYNLFSILTWQSSSLSVPVKPVTSSFKADRTYWLVGLSGDLGLSIADWMIGHGAKHLAITSRNPKVSQGWQKRAAEKGATVRLYSSDITNFESLEQTYNQITSEMTSIAGVVQGAMVLDDVAVRNMTLKQLNNVIRPKVDGSLNLDRLFEDRPLDFFIFFSSSAGTIGNPGQAHYSAANLFMSGLAEQRRRRGLAASVIDIGPVIGIGYVTRELNDKQLQGIFDRGGSPLSEIDVHYAFSEAVNTSPANSSQPWHIMTGLERFPATAPNRPQWQTYPQFACFTVKDIEYTGGSSERQAGVVTLKEQLAEVSTTEELEVVIRDAFFQNLRTVLQLNEDFQIKPSVRTDELGLDSLVAVRIRSWFLNHFQVNIAALKILKGVALQELITQAVDTAPRELTPQLLSNDQEIAMSNEDVKESSPSSDIGSADTPPSSASSVNTDPEVMTKPSPELDAQYSMIKSGQLSFSQSMFMFVHELLADKTTLNNSVLLQLQGHIQIAELARAVRLVGERHEALRTCIFSREGELAQGVLEKSLLTLEHKRIKNKQELFDEYEAIKRFVFDLGQGSSMRIVLLSYSPGDHYLIICLHHAMYDRASVDVLMKDIEQAYNGVNFDSSPLQHLEHSIKQREQYGDGEWKQAVEFWRRKLATIPEVLPLTRSRTPERRPLERYASTVQTRFSIKSELAHQIRNVARSYRSTPFHFYLAAFKVLLHRFLGTGDVCIAIADNGRSDDAARGALGPFLNTLPVRMSADGNQTFNAAVAEARQESLSALENTLPWELILSELQIPRHSTHVPLAQCFLNYSEDNIEGEKTFLGCHTDMIDLDQSGLAYDMTFTVVNSGVGETGITLNVQESLYNEDDAVIIANGYEDILTEFASAPEKHIGTEWRYRESALQTALNVGRGPSFECTWSDTLLHRLETVICSHPDRTAVVDDHGASISYKALSQKIDVIAQELIRRKAGFGCKVAVFQEPSVDWVASVVAILKIGAVYVPLDAATPVARLALIVDDSRPVAILTHSHTKGMTAGLHCSPEDFIDVTELSESPPEPIPITARADAPAIVLYTSGSTGTPKGVILKHSGIKHEFDHCASIYGLGESDVVLQQSAWSFDLSITQLFLAISVGAKLVMVSHHVRPDASAIVDTIKSKDVTVTYATPTEYRSWLQPMHRDTLRTSAWALALVAGEPVTEPLLQAFRDLNQPTLRLFNVYGPTETTCGSTKTELDYLKPFHYATIPVGRASANECFYIMDDKQNLQPVGQIGEVIIGGVGVAAGYLNNDKQTQASFLPDPFATPEYISSGWTTMYRTGDLGYMLADGTLVLLGRIKNDTEVKLNGVRTDLRDIEQTVVRTAPPGSIIDAAASQRSIIDSNVSFMVVHVVLESTNQKENEEFLKKLLKDLPLPRQMLPSALIPIQALPRTLAGKLDRQALAHIPIEPKVFKSSEPSRILSQTEAQLLRLWEMVIPSDLIGLHRIGADSDFFQVGGSSMLLIQLQREIRERLQVSVQLLQLFQASTLRGMAGLLGVNDVSTAEVFDWEEETALHPELEDISAIDSVVHPSTPPRVIVLTGATGFLGQHLLQALNRSASVEKIFCIANRNLTVERRAQLLSDSKKVECYEGDLRAPMLGLAREEASRIFQTADVVIHNGSDVSHLKTYQSLRLANVGSTKELVKLCLPRRIPLHYVSTTGVTLYTTSETYAEVSVQDAPPPVNGLYGYVATKWVNEVYLEAVNERYGLPVSIHRPSSIIRPEQDMTGDSPTADVLQNMLLYSRRIGASPISPNWRGTVDLVKPETVTRKIISAIMSSSPEARGENRTAYIHESGDVEIELSSLKGYLSNETGTAIQELSLQDWTELAERNGLSSAMGAVIGGMGNFKQINFPRLLRTETKTSK